MNLILIALLTQVNLYFLKDSPNLLVRIRPNVATQQVVIYYSFINAKWDSVIAQSYNAYFDAVITTPDTVNVIGLFYKYDGVMDDNKGNLYLFEVKKSPRMILPLSLDYLKTVLKQARKKITSQTHIDEAITLIDYVEKLLIVFPYIKGSELEININLLLSEINELKGIISK
ncbi:MAG: hypothetical protein ABIL46_05950 [candidate division WOR-3 bacterium]